MGVQRAYYALRRGLAWPRCGLGQQGENMENKLEWFLIVWGSPLSGGVMYLLWHISNQLAALAKILQRIAEKPFKGV